MTTREDIAGLTTYIIGPDDATHTVVLLHGFGAPGDDLVALAEPGMGISAPNTRFVFPEAPIALGRMYGNGRAWWHIDMERLEQGVRSGKVRDFLGEIPDGLEFARDQLIKFIDALKADYNVADERLVLGGFSQGAMLAMDTALRADEAVRQVIAFSPTLLCQDVWKKHAIKRAGLPVFVSHGQVDPLLPFTQTEALVALLREAKLEVDFLPFRGPHTITFEALERAATHLAQAITSSGT